MKIHLLSDLHLEFGMLPESYATPECDVVVLAGDIWIGVHGVTWAGEMFKQPVIYVPGNHEFYRKHKIAPTIVRMKEVAAPHVHVLDGETVEIDGVRFLGGTLWTDFDLYGMAESSAGVAEYSMNDYRVIEREPYGKLRPSDTVEIHNRHRAFLEQELRKSSDGTVVVTHHLPSEQSVPQQFRGHSLTPAYASNLEKLILDTQPALWVHGHTHNSCDYVMNGTRIVCNPRGYEGHEINPAWKQDLVLEI